MAIQSKAAIVIPQDHQHRRHRPEQCSSCCKLLLNCLLPILILLTLFLSFLIALMPKHPPRVQVQSVSILSILDISSTRLMANWMVSFDFRNPNHNSFSYNHITAYVVHHRGGGNLYSLSNSTGVSPFKQGGKSNAVVEAKFEALDMLVDDGWTLLSMSGDQVAGVVTKLRTVVKAEAEYGGGWWRWTMFLRKVRIGVDCDDINVVFTSTSPKAMVLGSTWCDVNWQW